MADKIAVVEDDPDVRHLLTIALQAKGYAVEAAADGELGLDLIKKTSPRLAILDVKMPKMNGFELLMKLREIDRFKKLPVLILTSLTAGEYKTDEQWRESMDVTAFMSKPFDTDALLQKVHDILSTEPK